LSTRNSPAEARTDSSNGSIDGEEAGRVLLGVRRLFLARKNPLDLAYTLSAFAEFRIGGA
jgi:hypothetical protein